MARRSAAVQGPLSLAMQMGDEEAVRLCGRRLLRAVDWTLAAHDRLLSSGVVDARESRALVAMLEHQRFNIRAELLGLPDLGVLYVDHAQGDHVCPACRRSFRCTHPRSCDKRVASTCAPCARAGAPLASALPDGGAGAVAAARAGKGPA